MGHAPLRSNGVLLCALALALCATCAGAGPAPSGPTGKIQGRIVSNDSGEPIGFADVALLPADTTMRRVGAIANADGTYRRVTPAEGVAPLRSQRRFLELADAASRQTTPEPESTPTPTPAPRAARRGRSRKP